MVTHVSPVKAAVGWALGVGDDVSWRLCVAPASITRIGITPRGGRAALVQRDRPPHRLTLTSASVAAEPVRQARREDDESLTGG